MNAPPLGRRTYEIFAGRTVPTALRLTESLTYPNDTLHLVYETADTPTYRTVRSEE